MMAATNIARKSSTQGKFMNREEKKTAKVSECREEDSSRPHSIFALFASSR